MCTVTFVPGREGYLLAMNRDERLERAPALPPGIIDLAWPRGAHAIYPRERSGGTWVAVNNGGISFALLNRSTDSPRTGRRSRGLVIPAVLSARDATTAGRLFSALPLTEFAPFRLVGAFPAERNLLVWSWNGVGLRRVLLHWRARHWFSSSLGDAVAAARRGAACDRAWKKPGAGSPAWVRHLHRSHAPCRGAFSVCVHRRGVATVSYTEIHVGPALRMLYRTGPPCAPCGAPVEVRLSAAHLSQPA